MVLRLVGAEHYRGQIDCAFVELRRGGTVRCSDDAARELLDFPGWFEVVGASAEIAPRQAEPEQDRMVRGRRRR